MNQGADHRRLDLRRAVVVTVRGLRAAWSGAWAILAGTSLLIALPLWASPTGAAAWLYGLGGVLAVLAAWGALTRIALDQRAGLGLGGVQFGAAELRIGWGLTLNLIFLSMILVVAALTALAVFGASGLDAGAVEARRYLEAGPKWKLAVMAVTGLAALALPFLMAVRLSLFAPGAVGRGRTLALNSLDLARGALWPLTGLWLLILALLTLILWGPVVLGASAAVARLAAAVALPWLWGPLAAGLLAAAYRQLEREA